MPPVELTLDTWMLIADTLADEWDQDTTALRSLSLVCKAMVPLCRKHLFSTLILVNRALIPAAIDRYHELITHNPSIIVNVRHLQLCIYFPENPRLHEILDILRGAPRLQSITLSSWGAEWDIFPQRLQILIQQLMHLPTITTADLSYVRLVPSSILSGCPRIEHLTLREITFTHSNEAQDIVPPLSGTRPLYLTVDYASHDGLRSLLKPFGEKEERILDLTGLKEVYFDLCEIDDVEIILQVLRLSKTLYSFSLCSWGPMPCAGLGTTLASSSFSSLTKLELSSMTTGEEEEYGPLGDFVPQLGMIAGINVLEKIVLNVHFMSEVRYDADIGDWRDFDSLVTRPGSFPKLKLVTVHVQLESQRGVDGDPVTAMNFPELSKGEPPTLDFSLILRYRPRVSESQPVL